MWQTPGRKHVLLGNRECRNEVTALGSRKYKGKKPGALNKSELSGLFEKKVCNLTLQHGACTAIQ